MLKIPQEQLDTIESLIDAMIKERKNKKSPKQTPKTIFNVANGFYEAALRCLQSEPNSEGGERSLMIPSIVNFAFACELYMKSRLMHITGKNGREYGHRLEELFKALDDDFKTYIFLEYQKELGTDQASVESDINAFSNAFESWRYVYEGKSKRSIFLHKLVVLTCVLYRVKRKLNPEWAVQKDMDSNLYSPNPDILFFILDSAGDFRVKLLPSNN